MTTEFSQLNLHPQLLQTVAELGYEKPAQVQALAIPPLLDGKDIIAQSQTGSGKTAAFTLPILQNLIEHGSQGNVSALVLTPTRELAIQVAGVIRQFCQKLQIEVMAVYGGQQYNTSKRRIKEGIDVLVGTPGRLQDLMRQKILDLSSVYTVILDEADEMLSMGFVEDIENILSAIPVKRQTALFSATISKTVRRLADTYMDNPQSIIIEHKQMTVKTIEQRYYLVNEKDKLAALTRLLEVEELNATLVFTRTRVNSSRLANELIQRGFSSEALNGDLEQNARMQVMSRFRSGQVKVLVATDVAARGLDIDDISHVVNFDLPNDPEAYVHRVGRTARAGKNGVAISLVTPAEKRRLIQIESFTKQNLTLASLPTEMEIINQREKKSIDKLTQKLENSPRNGDLMIAQALLAAGFDPIQIAAAAIGLAREQENPRAIEKIGSVASPAQSKQHDNKRKPESHKGKGKKFRKQQQHRGSNKFEVSQEKGMVHLSLGRGRLHGIRPGEIVGTIASRANIPGSVIGKILIRDQHTIIDVPEEYVSRVLGQTGSYNIREHQNVTIERATI